MLKDDKKFFKSLNSLATTVFAKRKHGYSDLKKSIESSVKQPEISEFKSSVLKEGNFIQNSYLKPKLLAEKPIVGKEILSTDLLGKPKLNFNFDAIRKQGSMNRSSSSKSLIEKSTKEDLFSLLGKVKFTSKEGSEKNISLRRKMRSSS